MNTHAAPALGVVARPADDRGVAIGGQGDGDALGGISHRAGADQLVSQLEPYPAAVDEHPRRANWSGAGVIRGAVTRPAEDGGAAVGGQRDRHALPGESSSTAADELGSVLLEELRQRRLRGPKQREVQQCPSNA
jgi:hypothetical protein